MKIVDITPETEQVYFCCLEDWSDEVREAGDHKEHWYAQMKDKGLRVKFAMDEKNVIGGMIQYLPIEQSIFEGNGIYVVLCIWIHGHKQGRGNYQKRGMGKALLKAAEEDVQSMGSKGLAAWGVVIPAFMRASWFKRHGYTVVDKNGIMRLLWKPFAAGAQPPRFLKQREIPAGVPGKVNVTLFMNGWCTAQNMVFERTKTAAQEFGDKVNLQEYYTSDRAALVEWGIADGLFIDGKEVRTGPPPSLKKIRKKIARRVKYLR
jgi:GNAT superfamily N-acetyltransferase